MVLLLNINHNYLYLNFIIKFLLIYLFFINSDIFQLFALLFLGDNES